MESRVRDNINIVNICFFGLKKNYKKKIKDNVYFFWYIRDKIYVEKVLCNNVCILNLLVVFVLMIRFGWSVCIDV